MYSALDLHTHTTASDGTFAPSVLVETAIRRSMLVLAITDHDSTEGIVEALDAARGSGLELWPGVELSTDVPTTEVHVLGYLVDFKQQSFQAKLRLLRESRVDRAKRMVLKLQGLGVPVEWERVQEIAGGGAIGRPHLAQAMLEKGHISSIPEAFDRFIGRNGPAYVERFRLTPEEAVDLIVQANGFAALAHPFIVGANGSLQKLNLADLLPRMVNRGLAGIEAYYPNYGREITAELIEIAGRFGLTPTGGSDFHGRGMLSLGVGEILVPEAVIDQVKARLVGK